MGVLALMADGLTNREIGDRLGLSKDTIKNHVVSILEKTGCDRRMHAARAFWQFGPGSIEHVTVSADA